MQHDRACTCSGHPAVYRTKSAHRDYAYISPTPAPLNVFLSPEMGRKISGCQQHSASAASADNQRGWPKLGAGCPCGGDQLSRQHTFSQVDVPVGDRLVSQSDPRLQVAGFSATCCQFQVLCTQTSSSGNAFSRTA